ncbi:P-loop containing nucleoside triphosphate hydrolase protein, partial [Terfezia boudieri ATCC MYA-4762]
NHPMFQQLSKSKIFQKRLLGFVIDEVHLCHQWLAILTLNRRTFRADYMGLGLLRIFFTHVPFMGLSATVPLHVRGFIHTVLRFPKGCPLIQRSVNRENVFIMVRPIWGNMGPFGELSFLIPIQGQNMSSSGESIPKTMVFTDGLKEACKITTALAKRLPKKIYEENPEAVLEYTTAITPEKRAYNLERFIEGTTRIMVCTEACGMGLDVPDVQRVIQWRVSHRCNLSSLCQRFGRAARRPDIQALAILFYTPS